MQPERSLLDGRPLHVQTKQVLNNVYRFMEAEAEQGEHIRLPHLRSRVIYATGVSTATYSRVQEESKLIEAGKKDSFETPGLKRKRRRTKAEIDGMEHVIRRVIHEMNLSEKPRFTLNELHAKVVSAIGFQGGRSTFRTVIMKLGFNYLPLRDNSGKRFLKERNSIRAWRISYLRSILRYREEGRPIIFTDEAYLDNTVVDQGHAGMGQYVTVAHAGGESGFLPSALWIFKTYRRSGPYESITPRAYETWLTEKVIPNLAPHSVLVMDSAPLHSEESCPTPTAYALKSEMQDWLIQRNIAFEERMLTPELYALIKLHKPKYRTYRVNNLLMKHGHAVLRLPPCHPELNPMEEVWRAVKSCVAERNAQYDVDRVMDITANKLVSIGEGEWAALCGQAREVEKRYLENEVLLDQVLDKVEMYLDSESESSDEEGPSAQDPEEDLSDAMSGAEDN